MILLNQNIFWGIFLSFMIGPVFFILLETSISKGFRAAMVFDLGVIFGDIVFISIAYLGSYRLITSLKDEPSLFIFGGIVMLAYGIISFIKLRNTEKSPEEILQDEILKKNYGSLFMKGFFLNIINIGVLGFWLAVIISVGPKMNMQTSRMLTFFTSVILSYLLIDCIKIVLAKSFNNLTNSGAKGIILDFRNNGGGYLDTAVDILSFLLPDKSVAVITRENKKNSQITLFTKQNKFTNTTLPVVMLINELSASATEITAWALQDFDRAIILGEKSYGKWSVQEPFALDDGSMLKITIGKWYTPKDRWIDGLGITPDVVIPILTKDFTNSYDRQFEWAKKALDLLIKNANSVEKTRSELKSVDFIK